MGQVDFTGGALEAPVLDILKRERAQSLSAREWKHRLAGYGYAIEERDGAQIVMSLTRRVALGVIPAHAL